MGTPPEDLHLYCLDLPIMQAPEQQIAEPVPHRVEAFFLADTPHNRLACGPLLDRTDCVGRRRLYAEHLLIQPLPRLTV